MSKDIKTRLENVDLLNKPVNKPVKSFNRLIKNVF